MGVGFGVGVGLVLGRGSSPGAPRAAPPPPPGATPPRSSAALARCAPRGAWPCRASGRGPAPSCPPRAARARAPHAARARARRQPLLARPSDAPMSMALQREAGGAQHLRAGSARMGTAVRSGARVSMLAPKGWPCQGCFFRAFWLPFLARAAFVRPERPKRFGIRSVYTTLAKEMARSGRWQVAARR